MVAAPGEGPNSHPAAADLPSMLRIVLAWGTLAKERIVDVSTLAS